MPVEPYLLLQQYCHDLGCVNTPKNILLKINCMSCLKTSCFFGKFVVFKSNGHKTNHTGCILIIIPKRDSVNNPFEFDSPCLNGCDWALPYDDDLDLD